MKTRSINPRLAEETHAYLDDLVRTGLYGSTATEVAKSLILDQLKQLIERGRLKERDFSGQK